MADIAASVPTDGDPDGAHSGTGNTTGESGPANPFDVDDEVPTDTGSDADAEAEAGEDALDDLDDFGDDVSGPDTLTSDELDADGVFGRQVDPSGAIGDHPLTSDDVDPDGAFESELDPDGAIGDDMPLTSDDVDPDGAFGMGIEPHGLGDAVDVDDDPGVDCYDGDVGGS